MLNQMLSCGGKNCKTYKYTIMKFIVLTDKGIKGNIPFEGAYEDTVKYKNPKAEFTRKEWCIDINSLEELLVLMNKYGALVVSQEDYSRAEIPTIMLFDENCGA